MVVIKERAWMSLIYSRLNIDSRALRGKGTEEKRTQIAAALVLVLNSQNTPWDCVMQIATASNTLTRQYWKTHVQTVCFR